MGETKLIQIILLSVLCQITHARPFTFPDGTQTNGDRNGSSRSGQHPEPEGRSIRGGYSQDKRLDIYSRYNVYEHEEDDYRRTTTTFRPYVTIGSTKQTFNRYPNANYNRLPPAKNDEPIEAEPEDDYDDDGDAEDGVDPPNAAEDFSSSSTSGSKPVTFNNLLFTNNNKFGGFGNLFGENRVKHKYKFKRRRPGQPCIPYDLFNRLRTGRDSNGNRIDPKTLIPPLNLVLADVNYYSPSNNYNGHGVASDTGASYDTGTSSGGAVFNNVFYDAVGGYPCTGGYKPQRPHGGPLGFFGQGGLFDWVSSADSVQSDPGEGGSSNKPTVVFNLNDAIDSVATNWNPGERFQMMMKVIAEFISSVAGGGGGVPVVGDAVDTVRQVNKEFVSLFT
ncbi:uncharacterized protein LOC135701291 [Ochlerotatus camptorhynchus]|uniref:uncharacterized protein LOC135701291 n=1 Tax=Ochlerotatus camptorhynchus TaxID=644619 RepID=UPI0031D4F05A